MKRFATAALASTLSANGKAFVVSMLFSIGNAKAYHLVEAPNGCWADRFPPA